MTEIAFMKRIAFPKKNFINFKIIALNFAECLFLR